MEPDQLEKVIDQIRLLPNAQVDCGTAQGQDRFFAHLRKHSSTPERLELPFAWHVKEADRCLKQVEDLIQPYSLPDDYLSLSMWELEDLHLQDVFRELQSYSFCWLVIADSFTQWLQIAATTKMAAYTINRYG